jgi:general secretion pathway protein G
MLTATLSHPIAARLLAKKAAPRALVRAVTLIEIMIVLTIIGLIAGGVAVVAIPKFKLAQIRTAKTSLQVLHPIADAYYAEHSGDCPTVQALKASKQFTGDNKDPWGQPYKIKCDSGDLTVSSTGPDGKEGGGDDIVIPEAEDAEPAKK